MDVKSLAPAVNGDLKVPGFTFGRTGLVPIGTPTADQWSQAGELISRCESGVLWWVGDWLNYGETRYGETYTRAVEETGLGPKTLMNAKAVSNEFEISRRRDILSWSHHETVAPLPPAEQDELLDRAESEGLSRQQLRKLVRERRHANRTAPPLPAGVYELLLADPPWRYDFAETECREIENQYPTMSPDEIGALPVPAADDAALFLWATMPKLREAFLVMDAWGFAYKTGACWDKEKIGMGYWFRGQHELLLVGTRGDFPPPPEPRRPSSVFRSARARHSEKPECVYEAIEAMFPERFADPANPRAVELFCRTPRPGWAAWGNEVP